MKKDGKYRFSLQFSGDTKQKRDVGELLEGMGNRKSALIVEVLSRYILDHASISENALPQYLKSCEARSATVKPITVNSATAKQGAVDSDTVRSELQVDNLDRRSRVEQHADQPIIQEKQEQITRMLHNLEGFML